MHFEQHTELDNLVAMQNLRTSANKGSNDAYDVSTSLTAAEREADRKSTLDTVGASVELHLESKLQKKQEDRDRHTQDQFLLAAIDRPTRFRTRLQKVQYEGATARTDAEEETRSRWLQVLCGKVSNTNTPMVRDKPADGKRASTLRARTRAIRKYAVWLASAFSVSFPREASHVLEYLQVRLNEPACCGSIKGAHQAMCFFEEVCGVVIPIAARTPRCISLQRKRYLPQQCRVHCRNRHHASQQYSSQAVEELVLDEKALVYRVSSVISPCQVEISTFF